MTATPINDRTIELIQQSNSFNMNANQLAFSLKISLPDAKQELLFDLLVHRLKENITTTLTSEQERMITFSRKDIERKHFKALNEQLANEVSDQEVDITEIPQVPQVMATYDLDEGQLDDILMCFHSTQRNFVARLLLTGEDDTRAFFNDTPRVFNQRLKRLLKYVEDHRAIFEQRLEMNREKDLKEKVELINQFFKLYDADPYFISNNQITEFFEANQDLEVFAVALDKVRYQGLLFEDWRGYSERTNFLLELNYQQQLLLDELYGDK